MTPVSCESWNLTSPIASRVYLTTHLLQSAFIAALKPIMSGWMTTIAAGLILAGAILSSIWVLHYHLVLLPHPWGIAALLTACGILACSAWVGNIAKHRTAPSDLKAFDGEPLDSDPDPADPQIEILVRLTDRSSGILGKRGCVVTIRYPMETHITEHGIGKIEW
jgi:hypothetical protein